eukprot:645576-Prorocentrum_minimum.AAC.2
MAGLAFPDHTGESKSESLQCYLPPVEHQRWPLAEHCNDNDDKGDDPETCTLASTSDTYSREAIEFMSVPRTSAREHVLRACGNPRFAHLLGTNQN